MSYARPPRFEPEQQAIIAGWILAAAVLLAAFGPRAV